MIHRPTWAALLFLLFSISCASHTPASDSPSGQETTKDSATSVQNADPKTDTSKSAASDSLKLSIDYTKGEHISPAIVYVAWVENDAETYLQPLYVCRRLLDDSLTGMALPYWSMNKKEKTEPSLIDAVTGATVKAADFNISATIPRPSDSIVTIYVEMDHSFDKNDWFGDQPAVLFAATIDLSTLPATATLQPVGWTPMSDISSIAGASAGKPNKELKYITHHKSGTGFGEEDDRSALKMVNSLTVKVSQ